MPDIYLADMVSIRPDRLSFYKEAIRHGGNSSSLSGWGSDFQNLHSENSVNSRETAGKKSLRPNSNVSGARLSVKAVRRIQERVDWLVLLSKKKKAYNPKTGKSFSFRINFVTLTLPALQVHDDRTIKRVCFNQFLTEARKRCHLRNFVWRAECQENGNIHFHLISDVYLNAYVIREIWNRCLSKLGYVQAYQAKFSELSFNEYRNTVDPILTDSRKASKYLKSRLQHGGNRVKNIPIPVLLKAYKYGQSSNWSSPNTTDVHSTRHVRNIASYLKKYVTKNYTPTAPGQNGNRVISSRFATLKNRIYARSGVNGPGLDSADNSPSLAERRISGRLWGCSQSLSKLKPIRAFVQEFPQGFIDDLFDSYPEAVKYYDYATCMYVHLRQYVRRHISVLGSFLSQLLTSSGYKPSRQSDQRFYLDSSISFVT